MRDSCPHRGIPLSCGWFDGNELTCKYHGWAFEPASGQCARIPSLTSIDTLDPTKIYATGFPVRGARRICLGLRPGAGTGVRAGGAQPPVPEAAKVRREISQRALTADLPCNVDHGIIGLMDPAHGPFVHQAWWWRKQASHPRKRKALRAHPGGLSHVRACAVGKQRALQAAGSLWRAHHDHHRLRSCPTGATKPSAAATKWFSSLTTVTPTVTNACRIDVYAAWNVFHAVSFVTPIATFFGKRFVRQDQVTMIQQAEGLKYDPSLMLIDDADRPAKWYFALKQARLDAARTGEPRSIP